MLRASNKGQLPFPWAETGGTGEWGPRDLASVGPILFLNTPCTHQPEHSKTQAAAPGWAPGTSDGLRPQRRLLPHQQEGKGQVPGCVPCLSPAARRGGHSGEALPCYMAHWHSLPIVSPVTYLLCPVSHRGLTVCFRSADLSSGGC